MEGTTKEENLHKRPLLSLSLSLSLFSSLYMWLPSSGWPIYVYKRSHTHLHIGYRRTFIFKHISFLRKLTNLLIGDDSFFCFIRLSTPTDLDE
jgi:hypothetical protein